MIIARELIYDLFSSVSESSLTALNELSSKDKFNLLSDIY